MNLLLPQLAFLQASQSPLGSIGAFAPLIIIFAIFYFLVIRPQRQRQKALQQTVSSLKKGDRIITNGGIFGEVVSTDDATAVIKIADNVKIKISKSAISGLEGDPDAGGSQAS